MKRYVPTSNLRFVERQDPPGFGPARTIRVLQQGWAPEGGGYVEWRDVPLQSEQGAKSPRAALAAQPNGAQSVMVLVPREVLQRCRDTAMTWTMKARVPECAEFGGIAQDLDALLGDPPAPEIAASPEGLNECVWPDTAHEYTGAGYCRLCGAAKSPALATKEPA